jgi:hypothetical protein
MALAGKGWVLALSVWGAAAAHAQTYIREGGTGTLTLAELKGSATRFHIEAVGANAHLCSVEGEARGPVARIDGDDGKPCEVTFDAQGRDMKISSQNCRLYCGMRAYFDGRYIQPEPICLPQRTQEARATAKKLYDRKKYPEARDALWPVLNRCESVLDRFDQLWIRNDLALMLHRSGDDAGCLKVLQPALPLADAADDEISLSEPAFHEDLVKIAHATRTNLKLCSPPPSAIPH